MSKSERIFIQVYCRHTGIRDTRLGYRPLTLFTQQEERNFSGPHTDVRELT
jgi:hypothetical protein